MISILVAHLIAVILAPPIIRYLKSSGFIVLACVPLSSFMWVLFHFPHAGTIARNAIVTWIPQIQLNIVQRLSPLGAAMSLIVLGIGTLILLYCWCYFEGGSHKLQLFAAELIAFSGVMFGLVTSDNTLMLFVYWELTSVLSFLLVGFYPERALSRRAAAQALLVTTLSGLSMLVGIIMIGQEYDTYSLKNWINQSPFTTHGPYIHTAVILILVGALSKSAIIPLHFWLPGTMMAPTPVSAYLHSAAMVKAGVFLIGTLNIIYYQLLSWRIIILTFGLLSMIVSAWLSLHEYDLKLILAYGTISQLGFLCTIFSFPGTQFAQASLAMLLAHALFKSALFMVVGVIDHGTKTRDIRKLAGLGYELPFLAITSGIACASMAGIPLTIGFLAKEAVLTAAWDQHNRLGYFMFAIYIFGSMLTCAYTLRFWFGAFGQKNRRTSISVLKLERPHWGFYIPITIVVMSILILGINTKLLNIFTNPYAASQATTIQESGLVILPFELWHGICAPLGGSIIIIVGGILIAVYLRKINNFIPHNSFLGNANNAYDYVLKKIDIFASRLTRITNRGSLPTSLTVIFITFMALSLPPILWEEQNHISIDVGNIFEIIFLLFMAICAGTTIWLRNRLAGILIIGAIGYLCVAYFAVHGAPDLALTQAACETLTLVFYVLGVRRFGPNLGSHQIQSQRLTRITLGISVGVTVAVIGYFASNARTATPLYRQLPYAAYRYSHGRNTVNVTIVDIRAWDTLGETIVLLIAGIGVVSLIFKNRRFGMAPRVSDAAKVTNTYLNLRKGQNHWLASAQIRNPVNRSILMEITTRMLFPSMLLYSIYLLFVGHNHPGGGFVAALIAGCAITLRYIAGGRYELGETLSIEPGYLLGGGFMLLAGSTIWPMLIGKTILTSATYTISLPAIGGCTFTSPIIFDCGVFLVVLGVIFDILRSLGARLDFEISQHINANMERTPIKRNNYPNAYAPSTTSMNKHT